MKPLVSYKSTSFSCAILLAFGDIPYLYKYFGGISMQGAFYIFCILIPLFFLSEILKLKPKFPTNSVTIFMLIFFVWLVFSTIINAKDIYTHTLYNRTGIEQSLRQFVTLIFGISASLVIYKLVSRENNFKYFDHGVIFASTIGVGYACIQLLSIHHTEIFNDFILSVDSLFRVATSSPYSNDYRITGLQSEPSTYCLWLTFVIPLLVPIYTNNLKKLLVWVIAGIAILTIILSYSRTGIAIILFQSLLLIIIFTLLILKRNKIKGIALIMILLFLMILSIILIYYNFGDSKIFSILEKSEGLDYLESNRVRFGTQVASLKLALDYPFFGIGLGQMVFFIENQLPEWALSINKARDPFSTYGLHARILAETGLIGFCIWLMLWFFPISFLLRNIFLNKRLDNISSRSFSLLLSGLALFMGGFSHDSLGRFEFWIWLGLIISLIQYSKGLKIKNYKVNT